MSEFKKGDRVVFVDADSHKRNPYQFPPVGTIGTISEHPKDTSPTVQWPTGSTHGNDNRYCHFDKLKPYRLPFDLSAFKRGEFAVNCETEEESREFLAYLDTTDVRYGNGHIPTNLMPRQITEYKENQCYSCYFQSLGYSNVSFHAIHGCKTIHKYCDLQFKEENTMQERLAKLETRQREVADKIKAIRETPDFTLDGFLRGDFAVSLKNEYEKYAFLGYLQGKTDLRWSCGDERPLEFIPYNKALVNDGKLFQDKYPPIKEIPFSPSILTETPSNKRAELHALEIEQRSIADEIEAVRKEMDKPGGYPKPERGKQYWFVVIDEDGARVDYEYWDDDSIDNGYHTTGNCYPTESEAQRVADMLNYFFLVQRKARELGGLLGYGKDVDASSNPYVLYYGNSGFGATKITEWADHQPMVPILSKKCAETLAKDLEVIKAAKKAWGVK